MEGFQIISKDSKKIKLKCKACGEIIEKSICAFKQQIENGKLFCNNCRILKNKEDIVKDIQSVEGYTVLSSETTLFINRKNKILVKHSCGNEFYVSHNDFTNKKSRCPECSRISKGLKLKRKVNEINLEVYKHDENYEVINPEVYDNKKTKLTFIHKTCNNTFETSIDQFIYNKKRCPYCNKKVKSKNENLIEWYLTKNNIKFESQVTFDDLKIKNHLYFDFKIFIEDTFFLLEYDGEQHFNSRRDDEDGRKLQETQIRDKFKDTYCLENSLDLVRINYTQDTLKTLEHEIKIRKNGSH